MSIDSLREIVSRLSLSTSALAALGAALEARVSGGVLDPALAPHVDGVLAALGARESIAAATPAELLPLLAEARTYALTGAKLLATATAAATATATRAGAGWNHTEAELLQAAGDVSIAFPQLLKSKILPELEGLRERLEAPDAAFLDVGVGVASLSIEMARTWPSLRVVGLDPWGPALARARENLARTGLDSRIELREQAAETLSDVDRFDLAWIPSLFLPEQAVPAIAERVRRALRPGGWLLFAALKPSRDPLTAALASFRTAVFGGLVTTPERVEALLAGLGFVHVRTLPSAPTAVAAIVVARSAQ